MLLDEQIMLLNKYKLICGKNQMRVHIQMICQNF